MPDIQDKHPKGDIDEDFEFVVRMNSTVSAATGHSLRFVFRGPYGREDVSPATIVDSTGTPEVEVTDAARKEITCFVAGETLASGEYRGSLKKTDAGARTTFARWRLQVRADQTGS